LCGWVIEFSRGNLLACCAETATDLRRHFPTFGKSARLPAFSEIMNRQGDLSLLSSPNEVPKPLGRLDGRKPTSNTIGQTTVHKPAPSFALKNLPIPFVIGCRSPVELKFLASDRSIETSFIHLEQLGGWNLGFPFGRIQLLFFSPAAIPAGSRYSGL